MSPALIVVGGLVLAGAAILSRKKKDTPAEPPISPPPGTPEPLPPLGDESCIDANMPPTMQQMVKSALASLNDPTALDALADVVALTGPGFPVAAGCLHAKAKAIRQQQPVPPGPPPLPIPPLPVPPGFPGPFVHFPFPQVPVPVPVPGPGPTTPTPGPLPFPPGDFPLAFSPPFPTPGPGGHAPFKLRPTEDVGMLVAYYLPDASGPVRSAEVARFHKYNPHVAKLEDFLKARETGELVLIPNTWQPYMRPIPLPNSLAMQVPVTWPALPPAPPIPQEFS